MSRHLIRSYKDAAAAAAEGPATYVRCEATSPEGVDPELERVFAAYPKWRARIVAAPSGCWRWLPRTAKKPNRVAFGRFHQPHRAYRATYELLIGPIPAGFHIDHLCRYPPCVRPLHLQAVTRRENMLRGTSPFARKARQTHCCHGHEFTEANTFISARGSRVCRTCQALYQRRLRAKRAAIRQQGRAA